MSTSSRDEAHDLMVKRLVIAESGRQDDFASLVRALPGVPPPDVFKALVDSAPALGEDAAIRLTQSAANDHANGPVDQVSCLPLPHPLDAEFRFTKATSDELADWLLDATSPGDEILLIGTPTVAVTLAERQVHRIVRFVGPDDVVTQAVKDAFTGRTILLLGESDRASAAASLVDPPWYTAAVATMLAVAARGCAPGTPTGMALPLSGTRPDAARDSAAFLEIAEQTGFRTSSTLRGLVYRTPLFELAAHEQAGLGRLPAWRRAACIELVRDHRPAPIEVSQRPRPVELVVEGVRLRLLDNGVSEQDASTGEATVFPSVSERARRGKPASLWTSGNRCMEADTRLLRKAMEAIAAERTLRSRIGVAEKLSSRTETLEPLSRMIHQLWTVLGQEVADAVRLVGEGSWRRMEGWRS